MDGWGRNDFCEAPPLSSGGVGRAVAPPFPLLLFLTWGGVPHEHEIALRCGGHKAQEETSLVGRASAPSTRLVSSFFEGRLCRHQERLLILQKQIWFIFLIMLEKLKYLLCK